jgi:hypothetical protein
MPRERVVKPSPTRGRAHASRVAREDPRLTLGGLGAVAGVSHRTATRWIRRGLPAPGDTVDPRAALLWIDTEGITGAPGRQAAWARLPAPRLRAIVAALDEEDDDGHERAVDLTALANLEAYLGASPERRRVPVRARQGSKPHPRGTRNRT